MKHSEMISQLDRDRIRVAIGAAEARTSGEIRVFVSRRKWPEPTAAAARHFRALGMDKTKQRNAVLIFIAPRSRTFAIFGDTGVHEKCGEEFWKQVRDEMAAHLKDGRYTNAVVHGVERAGKLLAEHFPAGRGGKTGEQSDAVVMD